MDSRPFLDFLREHCEIRSQVTVLSLNRVVFADMVVEIGEAILDRDLHKAKKVLTKCMTFLKTETELQTYNIKHQHVQVVEILFCYCYYKTKSDIEECARYFRDTERFIILMGMVQFAESRGEEDKLLESQISFLNEYLNETRFASDEDDSLIEKKIRSKAEKSLSPDGTPKNKNKSKKGKKSNLDRTSSPTQTLFVNGNDAETSFERIEDATSSTLVIRVQKKKDSNDFGTQTEARKVTHKGIQVDTKALLDSEILTVVLDIKKSIDTTNKREQEMEDLKEKLQKSQDEMRSYKQKVDEEYQKKKNKDKAEYNNLKKSLTKLEQELNMCKGKIQQSNNTIQNLLNARRNLQNLYFNICEKRINQTLHFLKVMKKYVDRDMVCDSDEHCTNLNVWKAHKDKINTDKSLYMMHFDTLEKAIKNGKDYNEMDWSKITDVCNVDLFTKYVEMAIQKGERKLEQTKRQNNNPPIPNRQTYLYDMKDIPETITVRATPGTSTEHFDEVERKRTLQMYKKEPIGKVPPPEYEMSEKALYQYLMDNTGMSEDVLCSVVVDIVSKRNTGICGMRKEEILKEIKKMFESKGKRNWIMPNEAASWRYENSDKNCTICLDDYSAKTCYTLPCMHKFHKKCIQKWLKNNSCCPICRVHTVLDDDFPPLG
ncbi:uncharacterized protein LOC109597238 [Aethina tumida]|uniref:uncharacterized protein LOC109597238 n=1 Tax=Aethina tumida TaxID=116153 RepID=UPI00096AF934|nr:uncharacterized protein LOC109597238 [Aethina tumida]